MFTHSVYRFLLQNMTFLELSYYFNSASALTHNYGFITKAKHE